jgi:hypothetical protein
VILSAAATASAQSFKVEKISEAPPQELSPALRDVLAGEAVGVVGAQGPLCEIWWRKVVPVKVQAPHELGITYGQLAEGTLIGVVRFSDVVKDYRRQRVKPGVYTLRYVLLPVDGNHMGVAPQRDFLLASTAAADSDSADLTRDQTINLSRKTTGTNHPSVWSLSPVEGEPDPLPAMVHLEDADLWVLEFRAQTQAGSAAPSAVVVGLVVKGSPPEI